MSIHISTTIHAISFYLMSDSIVYHIISNFKDTTIFETIEFLIIFFLLIRTTSRIGLLNSHSVNFYFIHTVMKVLSSFLRFISRRGCSVLPDVHSVCLCLEHGVTRHYLESSAELFHVRQRLIAPNTRE